MGDEGYIDRTYFRFGHDAGSSSSEISARVREFAWSLMMTASNCGP
jgi:hypothetical protein